MIRQSWVPEDALIDVMVSAMGGEISVKSHHNRAIVALKMMYNNGWGFHRTDGMGNAIMKADKERGL